MERSSSTTVLAFALTAAVPLNDSCLERDALESGHMERHISGSGGEVSIIIATAIALVLVPGRLGRLLRLKF